MYQHIKVPTEGKQISVNADFSLTVPDNPIIPYIEGDGTGVDISPVMIKVIDAAVKKAYGGKRKISWMEIYAGEKSTQVYGPDVWLPEETLKVLKLKQNDKQRSRDRDRGDDDVGQQAQPKQADGVSTASPVLRPGSATRGQIP